MSAVAERERGILDLRDFDPDWDFDVLLQFIDKHLEARPDHAEYYLEAVQNCCYREAEKRRGDGSFTAMEWEDRAQHISEALYASFDT